jgi:hypothetical protein
MLPADDLDEVELIDLIEINIPLLLHLVGCLYYCISDARSHKHQIQVCNTLSILKLSANLYDIYHCCVYSARLLMMDRGTVRNM